MTNRQNKQVHRAFLRRQKVYEAKYIRMFLAILSKQYRDAASNYPMPYVVNPNDYRSAIVNIYMTCIPNEAQIAWDYYVVPLTADQKDFFDDLASLLGFDIPAGEHIRLWRQISAEWIEVNILSKIQGITRTTQRAIAKIIESGIADGLSERDIARLIQDQAKGEINQYRSRMIARTESIMAMGQGRRMAMVTSNLEWMHKWVDSPDERTRTAHRIVARGKPIPLNQDYEVPIVRNRAIIGTEQAKYPADPILSAGNCVNCRCVEVFEVVRDAAGRPKRKTGTPIRVSSGELAEMI